MKTILPIICLLLCVSCFKEQEPSDITTPKTVADTFSIKVKKDNVEADNYSYAEVEAAFLKTPLENSQIVFTTDKGLFSNNSQTYTANVSSTNPVKAYVRHNRADIIKVTASIKDDTQEAHINFTPAYPSQLIISPDSASLASTFTSRSHITTKLVRVLGTSSAGLQMSYNDSTANIGSSIGTFTNNSYSDSLGFAHVDYWIQDTSYHGFVYIKGWIKTNSDTIRGINKIFIK